VRSGELARITGVTVRALRHYHQVGVLAEPPRSHNGYRRYEVQDVIRVLRIKRLAALGVPLERMPSLLDDPGDDGADVLDRLDAALAAEIDRLTRRRHLIAQVRAEGVPLDSPPEIARFLALAADSYPSPDLAAFDRDQSILLAHLMGDSAMPGMKRFYERMSAPDLLPALTSLNVRFLALDATTSPEALTALVEDIHAVLVPVLRELADTDTDAGAIPPLLEEYSFLFDAYCATVLNPVQRQAIALLDDRFEASVSDGRPGRSVSGL